MDEPVREQLATLPRGPGVYLFRDEADDVLYVGKAKSLRARVRSYFNRGDGRLGIERMVSRIHRIEVIVTSSESEALHLAALSSSHFPRYQSEQGEDAAFTVVIGAHDDRDIFERHD